MNSLVFSMNAVLPLFLLVILGYILKQIGTFTDEWLTIANKFSFKVTFSVMLFYEIYTTDIKTKINPNLILFSVLAILIITVLSHIFVPIIVKDRFRTGVVIQGIFRSNFLLFGMPLVINMFGEEGRPIAATLVSIVIPIYNLFAVITLAVYSKNQNGKLSIKMLFKEVATNPLIIGCIAGYLLRMITPTMPQLMLTTLGDIAKIGTPLALIILGGQFKLKGFFKNIKIVCSIVTIKLIICPIIVIIPAILFGFRGIELSVILTIFASPGAISSSIMAYNMGSDGELAGQMVVLGTLVSVITMFLAIFFLKYMAFI